MIPCHMEVPGGLKDQVPMAKIVAVWMVIHGKRELLAEDAPALARWLIRHKAVKPRRPVSQLEAWICREAVGLKVAEKNCSPSPFLRN